MTPVTDARPVTADPGWERWPAAVWPERPLPSCRSHSDVYADGAAAPAGVQASSVTEDLPPSRGATAAETARPDSGEAAEAPPEKTPPHGAAGGLVLAALGIVFGDIGTSPLYALQTVFSIDDGAVRPTEEDVYGVVSMMFWSVTLIVSIKYLMILMRADNEGEGGVMALTALARRLYARRDGRTAAIVVIGILGVSLFYGDSLITPAISVLSAVEGVRVVAPALEDVVVPAAAVILTLLFAVQRFGTGRVGALFGPVMLLWFAALAAAGIAGIAAHPGVLKGLSPTYAVGFVIAHPGIAFIAMGAVVLVITGAEALYADMGHFGRSPILRGWFLVVFPALTLNYLGQASLIISDPDAVSSPFFLLFPGWARPLMVVLATAATVIASQAVITGAFSLSRQAVQLGLLPPVTVRQTSEHEGGQIYLPGVNALLYVGVMVVMLTFGSAERLATAYGVSVTGALVIDTLLMLLVARVLWHWRPWQLALAAVAFGGLELTFLAANLSKVAHGGWLPLLIAVVVFTVMTTWRRGREIVAANRREQEGSLAEFVDAVNARGLPRVPGTAVFPHPGKETTPLALRANVEHNKILHENVLIVSASSANVPHVPVAERFEVDHLGYEDDRIQHLSVRFGFSDEPNLPQALAQACETGALYPGTIRVDQASFFLSRGAIRRTRAKGMAAWRKVLFLRLAHNAADPAAYFGLPVDRTVTMGSPVEV